MDASFVLITQDLNQRVIPITKARTIIGRQTDCNIRIPSGDISRQHCEIVVQGDSVQIKDLGSSNGTYVNRKKVSQAALAAGDLISVGACVFVVRLNGSPAEIDAEDAYEDGVVATTATAPAAHRAPESPTILTRPAPAKKLVDDDDDDKNDDSDAFDFDFSDDEDEKHKKPKTK